MASNIEILQNNLKEFAKEGRLKSNFLGYCKNLEIIEKSKSALIKNSCYSGYYRPSNLYNCTDIRGRNAEYYSSNTRYDGPFTNWIKGYFPFVKENECVEEYKVGRCYFTQNFEEGIDFQWKTCKYDDIGTVCMYTREGFINVKNPKYLITNFNTLEKHLGGKHYFEKNLSKFLKTRCCKLWLGDNLHLSKEEVEEEFTYVIEIELNCEKKIKELNSKRLAPFYLYKEYTDIELKDNSREILKSKGICLEFFDCIIRKNNYRITKVLKELKNLSDFLTRKSDMIGGTLWEDSSILYCDFDVIDGKWGLDSLKEFEKLFGIQNYFAEVSATNGGVHAWFAFNCNINNELRKRIEGLATKKGINVEITKFFQSNITRLPLSFEYIPLKKIGNSYDLDLEDNFFNRFCKNGLVYNNCKDIIEKLAYKENNLSTEEFFNTKKNEYKALYIGNLESLTLNKKNEENRSSLKKTGFELRDYREGHRYEQFQYEIPILKYLFNMSLDEAADSILARKGTSKDLSIWSKTKLKSKIKEYYDSCKLLEKYNKSNEVVLRPKDTTEGNEFYSNLSMLPQTFLDRCINNAYCYRNLGKALEGRYNFHFSKKGKAFENEIKFNLFSYFCNLMVLEFAGKALYESTKRIKLNQNKFIKNFQGVQFPDIYVERFISYTIQLLNRKLCKSNTEFNINYELNKIMKSIPYIERFQYLTKLFSKSFCYRLKRTVLEYLAPEKVKLANGKYSTKNHCVNFKLDCVNSIFAFLNSYTMICNENRPIQTLDINKNVSYTILERKGNNFNPITLSEQEKIISDFQIGEQSAIECANQNKGIWIQNKDSKQVRRIEGIIIFNIKEDDLLYGQIKLEKEFDFDTWTNDFFPNPFESENFYFSRAGPPN